MRKKKIRLFVFENNNNKINKQTQR